jgi:metallophosphoesterase (TIGR00282 family)
MSMFKILFIGDIVGKIGRRAVAKILPGLRKKYKIDYVIANAENSAHGSGITEKVIKELEDAGIDYFTSGDHAFKKNGLPELSEKHPLLRPANVAASVPGRGFTVIEKKDKAILLINLIGQVGMKMNFENPFYKLDEILANNDLHTKKLSAIIVDMHAETTSEKVAFGHYADGRVTAICGTHTHIMTADAKITRKGMAYISDTGMVGAAEGCLGVDKENIIKTFLTQVKYPHVIPEKGKAIFNAVLITINGKTAKASAIKPITKFINIK